MRTYEANENLARTFVDHSFLWLFAWAAALYVPIVAPVLVIGFVNAHGDEGVVRQLGQDGLEARATVTDWRSWGNCHCFPQSRVAFTTESGARVETWVSTDGEVMPPAAPLVRYSRTHPTIVRLVGQEHPHRDDWRVPALYAAVLSALSSATIVLCKHEWRIWLGE